MNAVMVAMCPQTVDLIRQGKRRADPRRTRPRLKTPFKMYLYETKSGELDWYPETTIEEGVGINGDQYTTCDSWNVANGKVVGECICDYIIDLGKEPDEWDSFCRKTGEAVASLYNYFGREFAGDVLTGYGWHLSGIYFYDQPKELSEFGKSRGPQSWYYVPDLAEIPAITSTLWKNVQWQTLDPDKSYVCTVTVSKETDALTALNALRPCQQLLKDKGLDVLFIVETNNGVTYKVSEVEE